MVLLATAGAQPPVVGTVVANVAARENLQSLLSVILTFKPLLRICTIPGRAVRMGHRWWLKSVRLICLLNRCLMLLLKHCSKGSIVQEERLSLRLPHATVSRLYVYKINVAIPTLETVGSLEQ